jgi:hypothetical protein
MHAKYMPLALVVGSVERCVENRVNFTICRTFLARQAKFSTLKYRFYMIIKDFLCVLLFQLGFSLAVGLVVMTVRRQREFAFRRMDSIAFRSRNGGPIPK